jgi:hypothetical protein
VPDVPIDSCPGPAGANRAGFATGPKAVFPVTGAAVQVSTGLASWRHKARTVGLDKMGMHHSHAAKVPYLGGTALPCSLTKLTCARLLARPLLWLVR